MSDSRPIYWLHLSDIHVGARGREIYHQVTQELLGAIDEHAKYCPNPPDMILVSGDIAFSGKAAEYEEADYFFDQLREELRKVYGPIDPLFIPIPGNHDLARPQGKNTLHYDVFNRYAESAEDDTSVRTVNRLIWEEKDRDFINPLFTSYLEWMDKQVRHLRERPGVKVNQSLMPGDLCVQLTLDGTFPLCIVGMNSAWLQYSDADFERKLSVPTSQFHQLLPQVGHSNPLDLFRREQRSLLMMHHPPAWLSTRAQNMFYSEIFLPDRFDMCLFGHMHAGRAQQTAVSGGAPRYEFQSPSLCGLDYYGKVNEQRAFGFTFGSITSEGEIRVWPYKRDSLGGKEHAFLPDQSFGTGFVDRSEGVLLRPKDSLKAKAKGEKVYRPPVVTQASSEGIILRIVLANLGSAMHSSIIEFLNEQITRVSESLSLGEPVEMLECSWEGEFTLFLPRTEKRPWSELSVQGLRFALQILTALKQKRSKFNRPDWVPQLGIAMHVEHEGHRLTTSPRSPSSVLFGEAIDYARSMLPKQPRPFVLLSDDVFRYLRRFLADASNFEKLVKETGLVSESTGAVRADIRKLTIAPQQLVDEGINAFDNAETHDVYNLCAWSSQGELLLGDTHVPPKRLRIDYGRKSDEQVFVERLIKADRVCLIGVTNQYLVNSLHTALQERQRLGRGFWEEIRVVFLARELLKTVLDQRCKRMEIPKANEDRSHGWGQGVREVREFFLSSGVENSQKWECLQFNFMLPFEAKRFDDSDGNSTIQMVPILPNADVRESYCIEATNGYLLYDQLANALDAIMRTATPIVEFNVYGHAEEDVFHLAGIVSQREWRSFRPSDGSAPCYPVSFILLHTSVAGVKRVLLQERTIFNTGGEFGLYSLISGKVNDEDFFFSNVPSPDYSSLAYQVGTGDDNNMREVLSEKFADELNLTLGEPISQALMEQVWEKTAIRELSAELGIRIDSERLKPYKEPFLLDRKEGFKLYIKLYVLELRPEELAQIHLVRPNANLHSFALDKMLKLKEKEQLSVFLCTHFDQYILPLIRDQIGVK